MAEFPITLGTLGFLAAVLAAMAWSGDRRRTRRRDPDRVGFMPWTSVFFFATFAACILLGLAAREWMTF